MSWTAAVGVLLLAAGWLQLPGLAVVRAAGLRGVTAWGAAPLVSVGVLAGSAVVGGKLGIGWGPAVPILATVLVAVGAFGARRFRSGRGVREPDGRWTGPAAAAGSVVAAGIGLTAALVGMGRPDAVSQTFDASFHYNAVARILDTGDASALALGGLVNSPSFYPAGWHAVVSLVASSGAGIVTASNMTALAVAVVVWPATQLLLVRQLVGPSAGAALATPLLALGFGAFPWALVTYGALWPNLLGVALMPAAVAVVAVLAGLVRGGSLSRRGALALTVVGVPAVGFGHPNAVFGLAVVAMWPLIWGTAGAVLRRLLAHRWITASALVAVAAGTLAAAYWVMVVWPVLDGIRGYEWQPFETWASGWYSVLTSSPNDFTAAWTISALVVAGAVTALRRARTSWLVAAWITTGALYVMAAVTPSSKWTGVWYNDSPRLAAMVPVVAVPLAVLGTLALAGLVRRAAASLPRVQVTMRPAVASAAALAALVAASGGLYQRAHAESLAGIYQHPSEVLLLPGQQEFLTRAGAMLPPDAVVAENPWTGNALLWTLADRQVLFPHLTGQWTPEQRIIAERLRDAATDPAVCAAVRATGTGYALTGPPTLWSWDPQSRTFPGLDDLRGVPGFEPMAGEGPSTLYRITACDAEVPSDADA
ncbi:DUF6541 family protein [Pseudonocardia phyllosphaerae]|uniref:DUF6541 family protein n=1 Tax=Pseudonocardia phyllosphaerae TaxID=3390502 RepID=UPI0039791B35